MSDQLTDMAFKHSVKALGEECETWIDVANHSLAGFSNFRSWNFCQPLSKHTVYETSPCFETLRRFNPINFATLT